METVFLGNTVLAYLISLGIFIGASLVIWIFTAVVLSRLKKLAEKTETKIDDFIISVAGDVLSPLLYVAGFFLAINNLKMAGGLRLIINKAGIVVLTYFAVRASIMLVDYLVTEVLTKKDQDETRVKSIKGLMVLVKGLLWLLGIILMLDNLGYKVSTIVAGLGIGGIAVALAAQAVLGDLFSYISIVFDKPFQPGDFIVVDNHMGTVENIGIKTTRIRSVDGEEIIFSNSNLTGSRIKNYKRMYSRRVVLTLGITYGTPVDTLKKVPETVKKIITGVKGVAFERAHLNILADSSVSYEAVYVVEGNDYIKYMDIKQEINFRILEELAKIGAELAYPTQSVIVTNTR